MTLRVLHCIHSLSGGGAERQLNIIANHASGVDLTTGIFCVNAANHELQSSRCELFVLQDPAKYPFGLIAEIKRVIEQFQPELVHCWLPVPVILPAMIAARWKGIPVVASFRNKKGFHSKYDYLEYLAVKYLATGIVSNNPPAQSARAWQRLYHQKISAYLPNAVIPRRADQNSAPPQREPGITTLLYVGRILDTQKNWRCLLNAAADLDRRAKWRLQICGQGLAAEEQQLADEIGRLDLAERVEVLGFRKDVRTVMAAADVLVLPSWFEGMPNVALEAMSEGVPCFLSAIPAHTELFGDQAGVHYFDPASPAALTELLAAAIDGRLDLNAPAKRASEFADRFRPESMLGEYRKFYDRILRSGPVEKEA